MEARLEERFARSLASNDKRTRNRTLKRLTKWLVARSSLEDGFTELEMLKLWKGLYVCMWHSDKPLVQEELVESLAGLMLSMRRGVVALLYLRSFFTTIAREWHCIDRLRLDKFYLLLRKMVGTSFKLLQSYHWDQELVQQFVSIVKSGPLSEDLSKTTLGVQLHVLEVYLPELQSCSPSERAIDLLQPCLALLAHSREPTVTQCVCNSVLEPLDSTALEQLQIPTPVLADALRSLAISGDTVGRNRKLIYTHCKRFSCETEVTTYEPSDPSWCGQPQPKRFKHKKMKKKRKRV